MFCQNCGQPMDENDRFCVYCGAQSNTAARSGAAGTSGADGTSGATGTSGAAGTSGVAGTSGATGMSGVAGTSGAAGISRPTLRTSKERGNKSVEWTKILIYVIVGLYAIGTVKWLILSLGNVVDVVKEIYYIIAPGIVISVPYFLYIILRLLVRVLITVCCVAIAYLSFSLLGVSNQEKKKKEQQGEALCLGVTAAAALRIFLSLAYCLINAAWQQYVYNHYNYNGSADSGESAVVKLLLICLLELVLAIGTVAGTYAVFLHTAGRIPLIGRSIDEIKDMTVVLQRIFVEKGNQIAKKFGRNNGKAQSMSQGNGQPVSQEAGGAGAAAVAQQNGGQQALQAGTAWFAPIKTNRSLAAYLLLNLITCGIYSLFFQHSMARDINTVCSGDGKRTHGLLFYVLLNLVTCGIYSFVWDYGFVKRLYLNAPRYGLMFNEKGSTVVLWRIFGVMLFGSGPFIALHIMIVNMNMLTYAYNKKMRETTPGQA